MGVFVRGLRGGGRVECQGCGGGDGVRGGGFEVAGVVGGDGGDGDGSRAGAFGVVRVGVRVCAGFVDTEEVEAHGH